MSSPIERWSLKEERSFLSYCWCTEDRGINITWHWHWHWHWHVDVYVYVYVHVHVASWRAEHYIQAEVAVCLSVGTEPSRAEQTRAWHGRAE